MSKNNLAIKAYYDLDDDDKSGIIHWKHTAGVLFNSKYDDHYAREFYLDDEQSTLTPLGEEFITYFVETMQKYLQSTSYNPAELQYEADCLTPCAHRHKQLDMVALY